MKKELSLLKPELKHQFLRNEVAERVEYIDVPGDIGLFELQNDIENGAVHMKGWNICLQRRMSQDTDDDVCEIVEKLIHLRPCTYKGKHYHDNAKENRYKYSTIPLLP